jgi:hypothetical protein
MCLGCGIFPRILPDLFDKKFRAWSRVKRAALLVFLRGVLEKRVYRTWFFRGELVVERGVNVVR